MKGLAANAAPESGACTAACPTPDSAMASSTTLTAGPTVRPMAEGDIETVQELEKQCFPDAWSGALLLEMLKSPWDEAWILTTESGETAAYANFRFLAGEGELMRIAVFPEFRGRGYSRKLMERLVKSAGEQKANDLTLEVRAGNQTAINLYEAYGFRTEAVRKNYYHDPEEDALLMWVHGLLGITT